MTASYSAHLSHSSHHTSPGVPGDLPDDLSAYGHCLLCPRTCGVDRLRGERGYCRATSELEVARAALHFWEEPPISGYFGEHAIFESEGAETTPRSLSCGDAGKAPTVMPSSQNNGGVPPLKNGSGTVFFSHCSLCCSYCQNASIAHDGRGQGATCEGLAGMMLDLQDQGALNINLVTATHYAPSVRRAVARARSCGLDLPIVWNTSGYETAEAIRENAATVDVYLTDFKYASSDLARMFSSAPDYPEVALAALEAMVDTAGPLSFDDVEGGPRLIGGVVVRHLILPGHLEDSCAVVELLYERFGNAIAYSLMNQYTPLLNTAASRGDVRAIRALAAHPELGSTVADEDYERLLDFADDLGIDDYYWQDGPAQGESFIPDFSSFV